MIEIVITGLFHPYVNDEIAELQKNKNVHVSFKNCKSKVELLDLTQKADIIMTDSESIDSEVIENAQNLKLIVEYGVGVDNIDISAASAKNILVCNVPDAYINEVAEHAVSLMLNVARNIVNYNRLVQVDKSWDFNRFPAIRLYGKTIGVVGYGNIGRTTGKICKALGMRVVAYDAYMDDQLISSLGAEPLSFDSLIEQSDIITLHVPLTPETHHMIDKNVLSKMKQGSIVINVARGGIIDEYALEESIRSGHIFAAGIDVLEGEPDVISPLLGNPNVILTPHMGWKSEHAAKNLEMLADKEVIGIINGEKPRHPVNRNLLAAGWQFYS